MAYETRIEIEYIIFSLWKWILYSGKMLRFHILALEYSMMFPQFELEIDFDRNRVTHSRDLIYGAGLKCLFEIAFGTKSRERER